MRGGVALSTLVSSLSLSVQKMQTLSWASSDQILFSWESTKYIFFTCITLSDCSLSTREITHPQFNNSHTHTHTHTHTTFSLSLSLSLSLTDRQTIVETNTHTHSDILNCHRENITVMFLSVIDRILQCMCNCCVRLCVCVGNVIHVIIIIWITRMCSESILI